LDLPKDQANFSFDDLKALAFLTESSSEHPLAKAIVNELGIKKKED